MAAIPESTRDSIILRLLDHAEAHWPQLKKVKVTYRGAFAYITGVLRDGEHIPLCRLRYGGSAHSFGFAIYSAHDRYQDALLRTGLLAPRKRPSTPPAPSTSPDSATSQTPDTVFTQDELTGSPTIGASPQPDETCRCWLG